MRETEPFAHQDEAATYSPLLPGDAWHAGQETNCRISCPTGFDCILQLHFITAQIQGAVCPQTPEKLRSSKGGVL